MKLQTVSLCVSLLALAAVLAGCGAAPQIAQAPTLVSVPTRTPRPTFTATQPLPTATRLVPTATPIPTNTPRPPSPTAAPPTATSTATPEPKAMFTADQVVNVRRGPGIGYALIARLDAGQQIEITGKNPDGDWWQFDFNGQPAWVAASMVTANDRAQDVAVAQNIPAAPAAQPVAQPAQPQPRPQPQPQPQPTQPPAPSYDFVVLNQEVRVNTNPNITVWCVVANSAVNALTGGGLTMQVTGPAGQKTAPITGQQAWAYGGYAFGFKYSDDCKAQFDSVAEGTYTAILLRGSQQVSEPMSFTVSGTNREFIAMWKAAH